MKKRIIAWILAGVLACGNMSTVYAEPEVSTASEAEADQITVSEEGSEEESEEGLVPEEESSVDQEEIEVTEEAESSEESSPEEEEEISLQSEDPVAMIGDTSYDSLERALQASALTSGAQVVLMQDVTLTEEYSVQGSVALDLNGYTISGSGSSRFFTVNAGATLTLSDSGEDKTGTLTGGNAPDNGSGGAIYAASGANLIVEDITITNCRAGYGGGIYGAAGSNITLQGATRIVSNVDVFDSTSNLYLASGLTINDGGLSEGAEIGISAEQKNAAFLTLTSAETAAYFFSDDDAYCISFHESANDLYLDESQDAVASNGSRVFTSLQDAINSSADAMVFLLEDVSLDTELQFAAGSNNLIIDLNGHTLSGGSEITDTRLITINDQQSLTVTDSSSGGCGTITGFKSASNGGAFLVNDGGSLTLKNITLSGNSAVLGGAVYLADGAVLNLQGKLSVSGNTMSDSRLVDIWLENGALIKTDMTNAALSVTDSIRFSLSADQLPDSGQKVTVVQDAAKQDISSCFSYVSVSTTKDCGLYMDQTAGELKLAPYSNIIYTVNGGTISGSYTRVYLEGHPVTSDGQAITLPTPTQSDLDFLGWYTDQDFSGDPFTQITENTTGNLNLYAKWGQGGVQLIHDEQTTTYKSFDNAFQASVSGDTIRLTEDTSLESETTVNRSLTLDLNGKTLSGSGSNRLFTIQGDDSDGEAQAVTLTVTDSSSEQNGVVTGGRMDASGGMGGNFYVGTKATLVLSGGTISGGLASYGGGVYIADQGTMNFYGGAVNNNTALNGGGIFVAEGASLDTSRDAKVRVTMTGNQAVKALSEEQSAKTQSAAIILAAAGLTPGNGSAVYLQAGGNAYFGNINIADNVAAEHGALYAENGENGNFTVDQAADCYGNSTPSGDPANVYMAGGKMWIANELGLAGGKLGLDGSALAGASLGTVLVLAAGITLGTVISRITLDDPNKNLDPDSPDGDVKYYVAYNVTKDKKYTLLQTAFDEAATDDSVVLLKDDTEAVTYKGSGITFSPDGFSLDGALVNSGTMILTGPGSIEGIVSNNLDTAALTISAGISLNGGVSVSDGICNFTDGTITVAEVSKGTFNMSGGTMKTLRLMDAENAEVGDIIASVSGGTISSPDAAIVVNGKQANLTITGADTAISGASLPAIDLEKAEAVSLEGATITAAGSTAVLVKDAPVTIGEGTKISSTTDDALTLNSSVGGNNLTINGGVIRTTGGAKAGLKMVSGMAVMNGGDISSLSGNGVNIEVGEFIMNSGKVASESTLSNGIEAGGFDKKGIWDSAVITLANGVVAGKSAVLVKSGTLFVLEAVSLTGTNAAAVSLGGGKTSNQSAVGTITGAFISGTAGGISLTNDSSVVIDGAIIKTAGQTAVSAQGGSVTVKGAAEISTENGSALTAGALASAGAQHDMSCLVTIDANCSLSSNNADAIKMTCGTLRLKDKTSVTAENGNAVSIGAAAALEIEGETHLKATGTVTVDDQEEDASALSNKSSADNTISSGLFEGDLVNSGKLSLSGGYFNGDIVNSGTLLLSGGYYTDMQPLDDENAPTLVSGYRLNLTSEQEKESIGDQYIYCVKEGKYQAFIGYVDESYRPEGVAITDQDGNACSEFDYGEQATFSLTDTENYAIIGWYEDPAGQISLGSGNSYTCEITGDTTVYGMFCHKTDPLELAPTVREHLVYTGQAQDLVTAGRTMTGTALEYSLDAVNYSENVPQGTNAGEYKVSYKVDGGGIYYPVGPETLIVTISKAAPEVTAPTAKEDLTYTGKAQKLVEAGSTSGGTLLYSTDGENYSEDVPEATNAGDYTVTWKVDGGDNYESIEPATLKISIAKATQEVTAPTAKEGLTYTGKAQKLVEAGSTTAGTMLYSTDGESYTEDVPEATNAGDYTVTWKVDGGEDHESTEPATLKISIAKATPEVTAPTAKEGLVYTGKAQKLVEAGSTTAGTLLYSTDGESYTEDVPEATNAGDYTVTYKVDGGDNYESVKPVTLKISIAKATPEVTAPTAKEGLVYTGKAQKLVEAGSTTAGTLLYSTDGENYSEDVPEATNAGDYTVTYKVDGGDNYESVKPATLKISIAKATPEVTAPTAKEGLVYTGKAQKLVEAGSTTAGTLLYSTDGESYTEDVPEATNAGDYTVTYKVDGGDNYESVKPVTLKISIAKATPEVTAPTAKEGLVYTGKAQKLVTAGSTSVGTLLYSTDGESYTEDVPEATNAGDYTVTYKVDGGDNCESVKPVTLKISIAKATPEVTAPTAKDGLCYTGQVQELVNAGKTSWGTMTYSLSEDGEYTTEIPSEKILGTYQVYYKVDGDKNHNSVGPVQVTVSMGLQKAVVSNCANKADGINISWEKAAGANGYYVYRGESRIADLTDSTILSYLDTKTANSSNGKKYLYYVQAYRKCKSGEIVCGDKSEAWTIYRVNTPVNVTAKAGSGYVRVSFPAPDNVAYRIYRKTGKDGTYQAIKNVTSGTSFKDKTVESGKTYYYRIKAYKKIDGKNYFSEATDSQKVTAK